MTDPYADDSWLPSPAAVIPTRRPAPSPSGAEGGGTPDAVKQPPPRSSPDGARRMLGQVRGRGVDWVRPSDLIARGGSRLAWRPMDFQTRQGYRLRSALASPTRLVSGRARRLPPVSAFGRQGSSSPGAARGSVGMG